ncbi:MAG TPA: LD-carboxypeptidase [Paludibacter sp.]|nr:LD-carboxypeptidase [Paludibacter sp.]
MTPPFLQPGNQVCIVSPSGVIDPAYIDGAKKVLSTWGFAVTEAEFARGSYGRYAGTREQRVADLQQALDNPQVKAILCSRGGYGLANIIDSLDFGAFVRSPKWLVGFSDITILHSVISNLGIASIHGVMAKHLTELPATSDSVVCLHRILTGILPEYSVPVHELNRPGVSEGRLIGGNLSVLMGLRGSRFEPDYNNAILFIEDIAEKPYHIDRMMQNLRFSGVLARLSGLVVGQFSDCGEDPLMMQTIAGIISESVSGYGYPVCFNFPAGHVDYNLPLPMGTDVRLEVANSGSKLKF